jgi:hypothetical protein
MRRLALAFVLALMGGCTTVPRYLKDIDLSGREQPCIDRCLGIFNSCAGDSGISGVPPYQVAACKESFRGCINNCPKIP